MKINKKTLYMFTVLLSVFSLQTMQSKTYEYKKDGIECELMLHDYIKPSALTLYKTPASVFISSKDKSIEIDKKKLFKNLKLMSFDKFKQIMATTGAAIGGTLGCLSAAIAGQHPKIKHYFENHTLQALAYKLLGKKYKVESFKKEFLKYLPLVVAMPLIYYFGLNIMNKILFKRKKEITPEKMFAAFAVAKDGYLVSKKDIEKLESGKIPELNYKTLAS